jgi:hypothetical protein
MMFSVAKMVFVGQPSAVINIIFARNFCLAPMALLFTHRSSVNALLHSAQFSSVFS